MTASWLADGIGKRIQGLGLTCERDVDAISNMSAVE